MSSSASISSLINKGYVNILNAPSSYAFSSSLFVDIRSTCNNNSLFCAGSGPTGSDIMSVVGCGSCIKILQETYFKHIIYEGLAWWYFSPFASFGFSASSNVTYAPNYIDVFNVSGEFLKLSWSIDQGTSDFRAGTNYNQTNFNKYLFIKNASLNGLVCNTNQDCKLTTQMCNNKICRYL